MIIQGPCVDIFSRGPSWFDSPKNRFHWFYRIPFWLQSVLAAFFFFVDVKHLIDCRVFVSLAQRAVTSAILLLIRWRGIPVQPSWYLLHSMNCVRLGIRFVFWWDRYCSNYRSILQYLIISISTKPADPRLVWRSIETLYCYPNPLSRILLS